MCLLLTTLPLAFAAFAADEEEWDDDSEIYDNISYDAENTAQLDNAKYVLDEIIIKFKEPSQVPGKEKQLQHEIEKVEKVGFVENLGVYVVKIDDLDKNPNAVLNRFKNNKYIEYVEPNYIAEFDYTPDDPSYRLYQSPVTNILNAPAGWDIVQDGGPIIAVIDSGVVQHSDLPQLLGGYSAVNNLSTENDKLGHGTSVAGVIGMLGDNGVGGAGFNWNASIMPVKVDDAGGTITVANLVKGIIWAADNGAKIMNLSLGTTSDSVTLKNAIDYAFNKGCAIFAATGNAGRNSVDYPSAYANVMAIGSTTNGTSRANSSNYGSGINVIAFGSYYSTTASNSYGNVTGTSFATPQAAALASLIWALNPDLTNNEVYSYIQQGAKPFGGGYNNETGYGLIDIGKTLELVQADMEPIPEIDPTPIDTTPPVLTLLGSAQMTIDEDSYYEEPGYTAIDDFDGDISHNIYYNGTVNTARAGTYTITYSVTDKAGNTATATRTVEVVQVFVPVTEPPTEAPTEYEPEPTYEPEYLEDMDMDMDAPESEYINYETATQKESASAPDVSLVGSNPIILHIGGSAYVEQGIVAMDEADGDISNSAVISGSVDTAAAGVYTITYAVQNSAGLASTISRTVRVLAPNETFTNIPYNFSGQTKDNNTATAKQTLEVGDDGYVNVTKFSGTITLQISGGGVSLSITKAGKYQISAGTYDMAIVTGTFNGNMKWEASFTVPGETYVSFAEAEVPLFDFTFDDDPLESPRTDDGYIWLGISVLLLAIDIALAIKRKKAQP